MRSPKYYKSSEVPEIKPKMAKKVKAPGAKGNPKAGFSANPADLALPVNVRHLKVYYKYVGNKPVPNISLQGEWLRKLGFEIDKPFTVTESDGMLMIERISS